MMKIDIWDRDDFGPGATKRFLNTTISNIQSPSVTAKKRSPKSMFAPGECDEQRDLVRKCFLPASSSALPLEKSSSSSSGKEDNGVTCNDAIRFPSTSLSSSPTSVGNVNDDEHSRRWGFVLSRTSRQGRDKQRWERCAKTDQMIRLVTGTVPVTIDGSVILVSAANKKEWILPKGGWERDETMEEGAMRETFEEAGLVGKLGPKLSDIYYGARKGQTERNGTETNALDDMHSQGEPKFGDLKNKKEEVMEGTLRVGAVQHTERNKRKLTLFPLYVMHVFEEWPEKERARKLFELDEAIQTTKRPEIRRALEEMKKRGLHHPGGNVRAG